MIWPRGHKLTNMITFTAMVLAGVLAWQQAQAAEATVITLSCNGNVTDGKSVDAKPDPVNKLGVVVNFAEQNVSFAGYVVPISRVDAANVTFEGEVKGVAFGLSLSTTVSGMVDRVTGAMTATTQTQSTMLNWDLLCKPANRLF